MDPRLPGEPPAAGYTVDRLETLVARGDRFATVYADPPWRYDRQPHGAAEHLYQTMALDEIAALPVAKLTTDAAHLHLCTTTSHLFDARRVIEAWGFEPKGVFVWVKPQTGTGCYWWSATEYLVLGVKGNLTFRDRTIPNWVCADGTGHGRKPERIRTLVERVSPGPYLELFGRAAVHGWTVVIGDEISRGHFDAGGVDVPAALSSPPSAGPHPRVPTAEYITVGQLARRLGVSRSVVYAHVAAGQLPHIRVGLGRGTIRIPETAVGAFEQRLTRDDSRVWSEHFA